MKSLYFFFLIFILTNLYTNVNGEVCKGILQNLSLVGQYCNFTAVVLVKFEYPILSICDDISTYNTQVGINVKWGSKILEPIAVHVHFLNVTEYGFGTEGNLTVYLYPFGEGRIELFTLETIYLNESGVYPSITNRTCHNNITNNECEPINANYNLNINTTYVQTSLKNTKGVMNIDSKSITTSGWNELEKLNKNLKHIPSKLVDIDDFCIYIPKTSPGSNGKPSTTVSTEISVTTEAPFVIASPEPPLNCHDLNNSYILNQTCKVNGTESAPFANKIINETKTHILSKIENKTLTSADVHDAGIFVFNTVTTIKSLNLEGAYNILDITSSILDQPLHILKVANGITKNALLWYPSSIHKIVAISDSDLTYDKPEANLLLHSITLNTSYCDVEDNKSMEICHSKTSQVSYKNKDSEFCTTFNPQDLCDNAQKAYLTSWKSLSFFSLVKNNPLGIKTNAASNSASNQTVIFDSAEKCQTGAYFKNSYGSNAGGVARDGGFVAASTTILNKRNSDENDLHAKIKLATFLTDSFTDSQSKVSQSNNHYSAICPQGTCAIISDGNPSEPIVCNNGIKTTQAILGSAGIIVTLCGIATFIFANKQISIPIVSQIFTVLANLFGDNNLPKKVKIFSYCYNATFMIYSFYLLIFAEQTLTNLSKNMCTAFAIIGYILYLSAIFLSIIMLMITLDAIGCWKAGFKKFLSIFSWKIYLPFIYAFGIPILFTAIFAASMISFFKRNDGYCWVRPDFDGAALWFPLILLLLTLPFYIILLARKWSKTPILQYIYGVTIDPEEVLAYKLRKRKAAAKRDKENKESENNKEEQENIVLSRKSLLHLIIPQIFLAIPLIAENLTMYYANLTGWHYLFLLTQALHLLILHGIEFVDKIITKMVKDKKPNDENEMEGEDKRNSKNNPKQDNNRETIEIIPTRKNPENGVKRVVEKVEIEEDTNSENNMVIRLTLIYS